MESNRILMGIPGLDEMIEGGVPKGYTILVSGGPGSGKSTFAMQFLYEGWKENKEKGLYVSMEETPEEMQDNFSRYGWDLDEIDILSLIPSSDYGDESYEDSIDSLPWHSYMGKQSLFHIKDFSLSKVKNIIMQRVEEIDAKRLVIDSLTTLLFLIDDPFSIRREILGINSLVNRLGCTTLLLTEMPEGQSGISRFGVEEFMAQGVIALYNIKRGSMRVRGLEILKMRGAKHQQNICMIRLTDEGVKVYPKEKLLEGF